MKRRITLYILLITALALFLSTAVGLYTFRVQELDSCRQNLTELLNLMDAQSYDTDAAGLVEQFHQAAPDKRLTVIAQSGEVLADSWTEGLEDHSDRPEVEEALSGRWGEAIRHSDTMGADLIYVAKVFTDGEIGRAAMPLSSVNSLVGKWAAGLLAAAVMALILAMLLARKLAQHAVEPLEQVAAALHSVMEGNLSIQLSDPKADPELRPILDYLDGQVAWLDQYIQSIRMEFTANVSHELKTPLTSIKGFTDMLVGGMVKSPEDQKQFLSMISVEVDRLIELINDVLKLSELESVAIPQADEHSDALAVAREVVEFLAPNAQRGKITLTLHGEETQTAVSPSRLRELVLNLVENGIKYNEPGGTVDITVGKANGKAVLTVADTGIGIPEEAQTRVFERFYRVDKGRTRRTGGSGLGLAIVKHITALYGGKLTLESKVGEGTKIQITLPLEQ
jgi:two-component system phosphate regulon sensor histidine kinase PhoR